MPHAARSSLLIFVAAALLAGAEKKLPLEETSNDLVDISAVLLDKSQVQQELGADLGDGIVVVRATVRAVSDKPVQLSLDDFLLVSNKDGQRSEPFEPGQIAGSEGLVVTPKGVKKGGTSFEGVIGFGGGLGSSPGTSSQEVKTEASHEDKSNPLLQALKDKILPEKEVKDQVSGLLYFQSVGKVKPKDLELHYKGSAGKLALRFRP